MIDELFIRLEEISKEGASVVVKIDGERWGTSSPLPYTVLILGGRLSAEKYFRKDSNSLLDAIEEGIRYYYEKLKI